VALSDELALWHTFLAAYRAQDRAQSDALMHQLRQLAPNKALYALYAQRIALTRDQSVDRDWDGVTNFESK
jgi:adenylate cyclase